MITTQFINLQSDYGFKRAFGTERFRPAVIRFLEVALGDDISIQKVEPHNVEYHDKEVLPYVVSGKRIIYDVYFTIKIKHEDSAFLRHHKYNEYAGNEKVHHFILEMQNIYEPPFEDRMTYYMSKMVAEQGIAGWNYNLDPVILIGVTDFDFPQLTKQLVQEFELREKNTGESLTKKLRMLFYSLKQVPAEWNDCETGLQKILYLIKNMDKMDKTSKPYVEGCYDDLFNAAESVNVVGEDAVLYSQSLERLRSMQAGFDYRYEQGIEKGIEQGIEQGIEKGIEQGIEQGIEKVARNMKAAGQDVMQISELTGLSVERVMQL